MRGRTGGGSGREGVFPSPPTYLVVICRIDKSGMWNA